MFSINVHIFCNVVFFFNLSSICCRMQLTVPGKVFWFQRVSRFCVYVSFFTLCLLNEILRKPDIFPMNGYLQNTTMYNSHKIQSPPSIYSVEYILREKCVVLILSAKVLRITAVPVRLAFLLYDNNNNTGDIATNRYLSSHFIEPLHTVDIFMMSILFFIIRVYLYRIELVMSVPQYKTNPFDARDRAHWLETKLTFNLNNTYKTIV